MIQYRYRQKLLQGNGWKNKNVWNAKIGAGALKQNYFEESCVTSEGIPIRR